MGAYLDTVPSSGIIRIRDMMYGVTDPFRLDQGDVSFDAPETVKEAVRQALADNHTHYVQSNGIPRLRELLAAKLRARNGIPVDSPDEVVVTNGGVHGLYVLFQALLEPGDEVIVPDPEWPPCMSTILLAGGVPVGCPLHENLGWRYDLDQLASKISSRTRVIYINSPQNPTGGVLTREDIEHIAALARDHHLWMVSDEAYEDVVYDRAEHVSPAGLPGMYDRTLSMFTFSKSYAITGVRLGYVVVKDQTVRSRLAKLVYFTTNNVSSIVQYGGIGALEGSQECVKQFRQELQARRDLFYQGIREHAGSVFSGAPPKGAFYAFLKIDPSWRGAPGHVPHTGREPASSRSWQMTEYLIKHGRIGCVPGVEFGPNGEEHVRFCFGRSRQQLLGALESMRTLFG